MFGQKSKVLVETTDNPLINKNKKNIQAKYTE